MITQIIQKHFFCVTNVRVIGILIPRQLMRVIGTLGRISGDSKRVIWDCSLQSALHTPFSALCPRIPGTRFTNYGLRVSGARSQKVPYEGPEAHKIINFWKPFVTDVLCNREINSQMIETCVCMIIFRVHAKGVVVCERTCFCLLSAFYKTLPSKNLCLNWKPLQAPSKNPS